MTKPQGKKRIKKESIPLPEGFPVVGSYVGFYWEGWRHGLLEATNGITATIRISERKSRKIPISDVEIPQVKEKSIAPIVPNTP